MTELRLTIPDSCDPSLVLGPEDKLLRLVEDNFDGVLRARGNELYISGTAEMVDMATSVFSRLIALVEAGEKPSSADVELLIDQVSHGAAAMDVAANDEILSYHGRPVRPKTAGQMRYVDAIRKTTITFGIGPAGTGKTYLAMAMAIAALKRRDVARIVLARPVVEAGESLGFLPGTLEEKLDPYVRPLYDALFDMYDREKANALIEQGVIEMAPLAFMRGRTLNNAFVILDEAQNTSPEQMKMFLTRLGYSSKFVITGDSSQRDLLGKNGLDTAREILECIEDIAFINLDRNDIVRHSLVAKIVDAYAEREQQGGRHDA